MCLCVYIYYDTRGPVRERALSHPIGTGGPLLLQLVGAREELRPFRTARRSRVLSAFLKFIIRYAAVSLRPAFDTKTPRIRPGQWRIYGEGYRG